MAYNTDQKSRHYLYPTYNAMLARCYNPKNPAYAQYGERGITVDQRWLDSFWNFVEDMRPRPAMHSIDRINNDKGYSKSNCRWATKSTQNGNQRRFMSRLC